MPMISYAQNLEDVLLRRVFSHAEDGFYIDVGANDPVHDSVTKHFYDRGWRGINIEPQRGPYTRLCAQRQNDINLNIGLSNTDSALEFLECRSNPGLSTFSAEMANVWREQGTEFVKRLVPVMTLAQVCEEHVDRPVDFLKIDAEAHEREVIQGGDWERWRPRVILIEAVWPDRWEPMILAAHYHFAAFDGLNRYYVRSEDRELLKAFDAPVHSLDDYISYQHQSRIDELNARLALSQGVIDELNARLALSQGMSDELSDRIARCRDLGPNAIRIAVGLRRMATRFPRLSLAVKHITRLGVRSWRSIKATRTASVCSTTTRA
jgi:FkbM family methyltransferase